MPSPKFWKELNAILAKHNKYRARGNHLASFETRHKRAEVIHQGFNILYKTLRLRIQSPQSFREKHMHALAKYWEEEGYKDSNGWKQQCR